MNKSNRKELSVILAILQNQCDALETMASEEEEKFDNMPEGLQESETGQLMEEAQSMLNDQAMTIADAICELESLV